MKQNEGTWEHTKSRLDSLEVDLLTMLTSRLLDLLDLVLYLSFCRHHTSTALRRRVTIMCLLSVYRSIYATDNLEQLWKSTLDRQHAMSTSPRVPA